MISSGELKQAEKVLENILVDEPNNQKAKIILAKLIFFDDFEKSLKLLDQIEEGSEHSESIDSLKTFAYLFSLKNNPENLDNSSVKNLYLDAINEIQKQNFDSALTKFIEVIRADRYFDNDGARKACIAIFKYLGEENELTLKHRRDFGRALYV